MTILFRSAPPTPSRRGYPEPGRIPGPGEVSGGLTPPWYQGRESFEVAAMVACVGMRAGAFSQIPLKSYRDRNGFPELVPVQPDLLVHPSTVHAGQAIWKTQMSISRDVWGYAAGKIKAVDAAGYPSRVDWLCPNDDIRPIEHVDGIDWRIDGQPVDRSMIVHVPSRWVLPGRPLGICPLEYSGLVDLARRAQSFGRDWFMNGGIPSAILYSDTELSGDDADNILARIKSRWTRRQPAVIGSGMRFEQVSVAANESQFLETMRQVAADIAISFNLPPERINAATGTSNEYANISQNQQQYLLDSVNPDLVVIQEALAPHTPRGQYLRWSTGAFLRSDTKTRYETYAIGLESEFITHDEVRAWEELPPMPQDSGAVNVQ